MPGVCASRSVTVSADQITAIVLCGGGGRRVGGHDKPLLQHRGRTLVAQVTDALSGNVAGVLISANRNLDTYARFGTVVVDEVPDGGPLAGIASCLKRCPTPYAFVCPGDAPALDPIVITRLAAAVGGYKTVAVAHDGRRRQNLHMILHRDLGPAIDGYLSSGERSVWRWLETVAAADVDLSEVAGCFADMDDASDLDGP